MLPLPLTLLLLSLAGALAGVLVNWATYTLAWNPRAISPWAPPHPQAPPRFLADRVPLWGWLRLRREVAVHGRGFWIRPLLVELLGAVGLPLLYWWEVAEQGLLAPQIAALVGRELAVPPTVLWPTFLAHAVLGVLMAAASLIDIDEQIIPDEITTPGTLLGLTMAALLPHCLLPQAVLRETPESTSVAILDLPAAGGALYVEPVACVAPRGFPIALTEWPGLAIGLACYLAWCLALTPRIWRGRRGWGFALKILYARVLHTLTRTLLAWIAAVGLIGIAIVWLIGGAAWLGLLTALVGMIGAGATVWSVRIIGSAALRREAMGFGDVTLMMMIGAWLGWQAGVMIFFAAPFAGLAIGIVQAILRREAVIPYGPYLCLGAAVIGLRWGAVWNPDSLQLLFFEPWLVPIVMGVCLCLLGGLLLIWRQIKEAIWGSAETAS